MMSLHNVIKNNAGRTHDLRCNKGIKCPSRDWHIQNDFIKEVARDIVAIRLAEIDNVKSYYGLR